MRQVSIAVLGLAVLLLAPRTQAQSTVPLMTVDAVNVTLTGITVTGVVQGDAAPSTRSVTFSYAPTDALKMSARDACHRSLLLALAKPGQYLARIGYETCTVALVAP